jgi:hypothetical protein
MQNCFFFIILTGGKVKYFIFKILVLKVISWCRHFLQKLYVRHERVVQTQVFYISSEMAGINGIKYVNNSTCEVARVLFGLGNVAVERRKESYLFLLVVFSKKIHKQYSIGTNRNFFFFFFSSEYRVRESEGSITVRRNKPSL